MRDDDAERLFWVCYLKSGLDQALSGYWSHHQPDHYDKLASALWPGPIFRPEHRSVIWQGIIVRWLSIICLICGALSGHTSPSLTVTLASGVFSVRSCTMMSWGIQANDRASVHMPHGHAVQ